MGNIKVYIGHLKLLWLWIQGS